VLQSALSYPSPKAPPRPIMLFTMLVLAYYAGLRGGDIARLRLGDVDLQEESVDIRETKVFKYRRSPLTPGVMAALKRYLSLRERAGAPRNPDSLCSGVRSAAVATHWRNEARVLDRSSLEGQRDHALLAFLYNTGARIPEALDVCPRSIQFESPA
jgi:integrase